ncbi:tRNA (adenosine(37)-N6)-threonylcarbamoyltransferase complex transferase subunit TsaD [Candidatus Pacearchaeota archaeon]|nr:tRNA (adenosine(37)-N6)-threonylcarbamoyltransferase complex transferase subunit TsaD [Candidatus Pacearchaeota archaeon]
MILGIECTAHTFGIAVVNNGKILSNVKDMYVPESGGIIPMDSAAHHKNVAEQLYNQALEKAKISESKIEAIALSNAPGLAPCLRAGLEFAKSLAKKLSVKIIPVNHCIAHLEISRSVGAIDPVLLYASGANTQIIAFAAGKYRVFGETLDVGIGNFIDKVARHFGIGFPGGPKIEQHALKGKYVELPYSIKGMDVSFSGMQTKIQQLYDKGESIENLSFSLQETAFAMLVEAAERALAHTGKKELVLGGGVACNSRLQEMCKIMCSERLQKTKFFCPERPLLVDNAAMIAYTGELMIEKDKSLLVSADKIDILPRERTDQVKVTWR